MDKRYMSTRKHLDGLGYCEGFSLECLPLVEKLTGDLMQTTRSLQHYMSLAKVTLKEKDALKCAAEPYICDNAKLIKENNRVHRDFITLKEEFDAYKKDACSKIRKLENNLSNLEFDYRQLQTRCRERELKNLCADTFSSRSKCVSNFTRPCCSQRSKYEKNPEEACFCNKKPCANCPELENQIDCLTKNFDDFQDRNVKLSDTVAFLKCQVRNRDKENVRLTKLLEGGRPFTALQKDCCGRDLDRKLVEVCVELQDAESRAESLASELKESLDKQHEAMNRAIHLADRNTLLEKELCNIDRLALKVECECNNLLKDKCDTILNLENKLESEKNKQRKLEIEIISLKELHRSLQAELESNKNENAALNIALVSSSEMKEKLSKENEILNGYKSRGNSARSESFPLSGRDNIRTNSPLGTMKFSQNNQMFCEHSNQTKTGCLNNDKTSKDDVLFLLEKERKLYESQINEIRRQLADATKLGCKYPERSQECASCEKLKEERNFYYKKSFMSHPQENFILELKTKNCELEKQIQGLRNHNESLLENNRSLKLCMEQVTSSHVKSSREPDSEMQNYMQLAINKLERDLKRAHADIISLEEERNHLKCKLISHAAESLREDRDHRKTPLQMRDYERMTSMIENLTRERDDLSERLKIMESEFLHVKSLNSQLKTLQLENDKNIADCQSYSYESKRELRESYDKVRLLEKCKAELEHECQILKSDKMTLRDNMTKIDQERDRLIMDIDEKTEKLSRLEHDLRSKDTTIEMLENKTKELNKKMDLLTTSNASLEHRVRDSQTRSEAISIELQTISKQRDNALIENRRLQSDLAAVNNDLKVLKREYDNSRKEVEQMKQQLQHYVDEVRRIEDILSRKEAERTDMLDHFASLSQEATVLENNNHSLENEAASKSLQLQTTLERLSELEKKLESRESLIDMQEAKMSALIYNISKLESELSQQKDLTSMAEKNLEYAREMCSTLEKQKKSILIGVGETDCEKKKLELHLRSLKDEKMKVEESYMKDRATVESLESLLNTSRREVVELKLQLQEALEETRQLKDKIDQLQNRLKKVEGESHSSRQRSEEAAKNLQELKWQINDQRFQRVRIADQQSSSKYCSGTL